MNFQQAIASYMKDTTRGNLHQLTCALGNEMTLREKTGLLHGGTAPFVTRILYGVIFQGSMFYLPFAGGGCRRLGIPRYYFSDGPKGAVTGHGTCFPVALMRGASFDTDLEYRVGTAMAREAVAAGANYFAGICLNLVRNPRGGRSQESYGEDPFLLGQMGSTLVKSVQAEGVIACPKHFALNSIENLRFQVNVVCDDRTLREIYLYHFKKSIDAGALSIMGAYNQVNGAYCCENRQLLQEILRAEWGFDGFVLSDFVWGVHDASEALNAGTDSEMPMPRFYNYRNIRKRIRKKELAESDVNRAVQNILGALIRLTPNIKPQPRTVMKCQEHRELAEEAAVKGMVLLKNENSLLPLARQTRIAVVGPYADTVNVGDNGSSKVAAKDGVTTFAGLSARFPNVIAYNGLNPQKALEAAAEAKTVIACIGCNARDEGEFLINFGQKMKRKPRSAIGGDRDSLELNPAHLELLRTLKMAGKKVIAVLYTGSVILTENIEAYTDAIIMGYYGGIGFGNALAALVCGEKNFSGKLPVSIARQAGDYPTFLDIGQKPYEIDYGYYNGYYLLEKNGKLPSYPFGFGLSYTRFAISDIHAARNGRGGITVTASIQNTGLVAGAEVVQVYVGSASPGHRAGEGAAEGSAEVFAVHRPVRMLRGFRRIELAPGEISAVSIAVAENDLKFYDVQIKAWVLDPLYHVSVGNSSLSAVRTDDVYFAIAD